MFTFRTLYKSYLGKMILAMGITMYLSSFERNKKVQVSILFEQDDNILKYCLSSHRRANAHS